MEMYNRMDRGTLLDRLYRHRTCVEKIFLCMIAGLLVICILLFIGMVMAWNNSDHVTDVTQDKPLPAIETTTLFYRRARIQILDPITSHPISDDVIDWK
ncbi:hypothetical protein M8J76_000572 [Diaphorina citri]|nr:hypothetical protein M8J75_003326 [Diaphorina citri]KAI5748608.1 hypothetical protein M8J76_000572 [Diaphorina citri]